MKRMSYIVLLLTFAFSALHVKAQNDAMSAYWEGVDFGDTTLIGSKVLDDKMVDFFFSFTDGDEQRFDSLSIKGLGVLLGKAKTNMKMYEYVLGFALNGYANMGRDAVTDYLLNYPQIFEGEITIEQGMRLDSITEPYQKVRVGVMAPDYSGTTIDNRDYSLYGSDAQYVIVVFWSTDCEYCHDFLTQIRRHLDLKSDFELVTFALAGDKEEVAKQVKKMRLTGYHFYDDLRWESKPFLDYHITSTPTVFVLDKSKTIVCKPYDWYELKDWLKLNSLSY